jgi:hypothetical protein
VGQFSIGADSSGKPWHEIGSRAISANTTYSNWKRNGKWDALKAALTVVRGNKLPMSVTEAPQLIPLTPGPALLQGPRGWQMTDEEWHAVGAALRAQGLGFRDFSRGRLDVALEKFGSGRTWKQTAPDDEAPIWLYSLWVRTGRWEALVGALTKLRSEAVIQPPRSR